MQAAVRISMCEFYDAGTTVLDERQKLQERKSKDSDGPKFTPPPSTVAYVHAWENLPR